MRHLPMFEFVSFLYFGLDSTSILRKILQLIKGCVFLSKFDLLKLFSVLFLALSYVQKAILDSFGV